MAFVGNCVEEKYKDRGDDYCSYEKKDCQQFPTPCPELENATPENKMMGEWYMSNGVNQSQVSDRNTHEGACSGDWTLGMISDELELPKGIKPGKCAHEVGTSISICLFRSRPRPRSQTCCRGAGTARRRRRSGVSFQVSSPPACP